MSIITEVKNKVAVILIEAEQIALQFFVVEVSPELFHIHFYIFFYGVPEKHRF